MVATEKQSCAQRHEERGRVWMEKEICRSKYDTQKIKRANRVKQQESIRKKTVGRAQGRELCEEKKKKI
jgi:hypothetical protein